MYIKFQTILNSLEEFENTVRILFNPTVYTLYLPYVHATSKLLFDMKTIGDSKLTLKTTVDENLILREADPMFKVNLNPTHPHNLAR